MVRQLRFVLFLLVLAFSAGSAFAAETGSLSGTVRADDGSALPGVAIRVVSEVLPAGRSVVTGADGTFNLLRLPPGVYKVTAELSGLGKIEREVEIGLDRDTQLPLVLNPSLSEAITVSAAAPELDVRSTEVQVNYTQETIESLPLARDYKGLFQLAPGVSENQRLAPNAGGSRLDNTYLLDGINITNPHYGDILPNVTDIDIDEVNIKRGGITAEFGRTGGMVVNAVTRSGTNQLRGQVRLEYQPADFVSDNKNATVQNTTDRDSAAAALGGPVIRDHFWFYGSASRPSVTTTDRRNNLGAVPDSELTTDEYFLKLTANPGQNHYLAGSFRSRETTNENANITANAHPSVGTNDSTDYLLATLSWTWNLTTDSFAEVKLNHNKEENSGIPRTDLGYRPTFNANRPDLVGQFTTTGDRIVGGATGAGQTVGGNALVNHQDFQRDELRLTFQSFRNWFDVSHDLRAGVTYNEDSERLDRRANGWGTVTWNPTTRLFTATYTSIQPPHTGRGKAYGVFLQDQVLLSERATLTAGLLVNKDEYYGEGLGSTPGTKRKVKILTFDWDQQIQPRLGFSFVPNLETGDKLWVNLGRYMNTENKSLERAASPTRIFTTRATFNANGQPVGNEVPAANTQTKTVDSGIDPQYTDEIVAGYARPLGQAWTAELYGIYRDVGDIFEDVSADGRGNGPFRVSQLPDAYRRYKAVTLQLSRAAVDDRLLRLTLNASYTWSRLSGNWDIDFSTTGDSPFLNSSFIQDGPGVLITDNRDGLLRGDRTHVAKVLATIEPWQRTRVGTYVRFQSGGAWEARALPEAIVSSSSFIRYLEPAGSRRMEDWLNVDLLASHEFVFGRLGLELEGRVLNLFDEQVALSVDDRRLLGRPADNPPVNPNFGKGTVFSAPRAFVASAIVRF